MEDKLFGWLFVDSLWAFLNTLIKRCKAILSLIFVLPKFTITHKPIQILWISFTYQLNCLLLFFMQQPKNKSLFIARFDETKKRETFLENFSLVYRKLIIIISFYSSSVTSNIEKNEIFTIIIHQMMDACFGWFWLLNTCACCTRF